MPLGPPDTKEEVGHLHHRQLDLDPSDLIWFIRGFQHGQESPGAEGAGQVVGGEHDVVGCSGRVLDPEGQAVLT